VTSRQIWLLVAVIAVAIAAYEIVGIDPAYVGIHTISFEAFFHPVLRWGVAFAGIVFVVWWLRHSSSRKQK
jgi:hypothetical protein